MKTKGIKSTIKKNAKLVSGAIASESDYNTVMSKIDELMSKGSKNVSKGELAEIRRLALMAQAYEKKKYVIELPSTFAGLIEMKMYELSLKQTELAKKLHVSDTKLSLIMSGKQKPDVLFLKAVHEQLHVDANLLLEAV
jgi:HTH-type transcriptional regulator/antitoxin HigA